MTRATESVTVELTPAAIKADGENRVARTAGQSGVATAVVTVGEWVAQQIGWDGSLPTTVAGAFIIILTAAAAMWTNRAKLRGEV